MSDVERKRVTARRIVEAIDNITRETGYPPSPEELADVLGVSTRSLHSKLMPDKRRGAVGYDDAGNLIIRGGAGGCKTVSDLGLELHGLYDVARLMRTAEQQ